MIFILHVCADERFPEYGKVEFVFSYGPEKIKGTFLIFNFTRRCVRNQIGVNVTCASTICWCVCRSESPGEWAERFCGLQHPGPSDPLGLVRDLQPWRRRHRGHWAWYVPTKTHLGCLHDLWLSRTLLKRRYVCIFVLFSYLCSSLWTALQPPGLSFRPLNSCCRNRGRQ